MRVLFLAFLLAPGLAAAAPDAGGGAGSAWSLLAPLVAIGLALTTRRVLPSLVIGAVVGAAAAAGGSPLGTLAILGSTVRGVVIDADHTVISIFSLLVAATVGVMAQAGGTRALVRQVERWARGPRGAMTASWAAGAVIFFDDYANCLVVGSAMGPLYDRFRVSRAKLAYIVDSTAAPVASLAIVSTWVGYEVGLIDDALQGAGATSTGFSIFVESLPYRFYSLFTLAFVGSIALMGRDFGPMLAVELEAGRQPAPAPQREPGDGSRWWLAAVPVLALVGVTVALLYLDGRASLGEAAPGARLFEILGAADAYGAMLRGSAVAFALAVGLSAASGALPLSGLARASWVGIRPVLGALLVLYLAWTLSQVVTNSGAATFLAGALEGRMPGWLLPTVAFLLASGTAFATGTSFGTMGILIPLVVPLSIAVGGGEGHILVDSTAAILAGACLGDHASPISDTTVLSALGCGVDVITHVRTQLPYALSAGVISIVFGHLPTGLGVSPWLVLPMGVVACVLVVRFVGRPSVAAGLPEGEPVRGS